MFGAKTLTASGNRPLDTAQLVPPAQQDGELATTRAPDSAITRSGTADHALPLHLMTGAVTAVLPMTVFPPRGGAFPRRHCQQGGFFPL